MDVIKLTDEWQDIPDGAVAERGGEYRMTLGGRRQCRRIQPKPTPLVAALSYLRAGLSLIPCNPAPDKSPVSQYLPADEEGKRTWAPYQVIAPTENTVRIWFTTGSRSIGLLGGKVSGNLEILDFDAPELFLPWAMKVEQQRSGLVGKLVKQKTPRGGFHVMYRCSTIGGCGPLARRKTKEGKTEKLIETKAEGGYVLVYPSAGYSLLNGDIAELPTISEDDRAVLLEMARSFDDMPAQMPPRTEKPPPADLWDVIDSPRTTRTFSREDDVDCARVNLTRLASWRVDDYDEWVHVGLALSELGDDGLNLWDTWSQLSSKYPGRQAIEAKWSSFKPEIGVTLASLGGWAKQDDPQLAGGNGSAPQPARAATAPVSSRRSARYIAELAAVGYHFRLNACTDDIEVNGQEISDCLRAEIRTAMRDRGYGKALGAIEDAYITDAARNIYHPVHAYLNSVENQGPGHIDKLASYFTDTHGVFPLYLRRWLIGAVDKALTGKQNAMLVLDGPQGTGKSFFASWLCPLRTMFVDAPIDPTNKDDDVKLISRWVWEVSELGATTRRTDREALKAFISREWVTLRKAYGRYPITKPALSSFIGTINNESGVLSDQTGNRRFNVCTITAIDWSYTQCVDLNAVWAEAVTAYQSGERGQLMKSEAKLAATVNEDFIVDDPLEAFIKKYYVLTGKSTDWVATVDIIQKLQESGYRGTTRSIQMELAAAMKRLGLEKRKRNEVRGYEGLSLWVSIP